MMKSLRLLSCVALMWTLALPLRAEQVTIFAASSLKTALDQVIETHGLDAVAVYGGSAAIARQISQGAEADITLLAHPIWMDWLMEQDVLDGATRCNLLGNTLVLAGSADAKDLAPLAAQDIIKALEGGRLAVGDLRSVPAGQYTAEYLENRSWLAEIKPHLAQTSNVRLALALIARSEAPLGFVYASDVFAEPKVRSVFVPDPHDYSAIRYPLALTKDASTAAREVARILAQNTSVFTQYGFRMIPENEDGRCS